MGLLRRQGAQGFRALPQNKQGTPRHSHSRGSGLASGPSRGKGSRGLGSMGWCAPAFPSLPPALMDQSQGYCLTGGAGCVIPGTILAPRGRGKESKERSCCSRWNLRLERIPRACWAREGCHCGSKTLGLKGAGGGCSSEPSERAHKWGTPGLVPWRRTH